MTDETKTTDEGATDDAALESAGTGGTPGAEGRDAESGETDWKARAEQLQAREEAWKRQVEEAKEAKARLAEYEASASSPAVREDVDEEAELLRLNRELASKGDVASQLALRERDIRLRSERQAIVDRDLARLPETEAKEVEEHIRRNPGRFGDVKAAKNDLKATKQDDEVKKLRERIASLERPPDPNVTKAPPTQGREYSARETKAKEMTYEQYDAQLAELRGSGKIKESLQLQAELNGNKIRLRN